MKHLHHPNKFERPAGIQCHLPARLELINLLEITANSYAFGMNDNADVVGESPVSGTGYYFAFYKPNGGTMVNVGTLSGTVASEAWDINNNGLIVGDSID